MARPSWCTGKRVALRWRSRHFMDHEGQTVTLMTLKRILLNPEPHEDDDPNIGIPKFAFQVYTTIPLDSENLVLQCDYLNGQIDFWPALHQYISPETLAVLDQKAGSPSPDRYLTITGHDETVIVMTNIPAGSIPDLQHIIYITVPHDGLDLARVAQAFTSALVENLPEQKSVHLEFRRSPNAGLASLGSLVDAHRALVDPRSDHGIGAMQTVCLRLDTAPQTMRVFPNDREEAEGANLFRQYYHILLVIIDRPDFLNAPGVLFLQAEKRVLNEYNAYCLEQRGYLHKDGDVDNLSGSLKLPEDPTHSNPTSYTDWTSTANFACPEGEKELPSRKRPEEISSVDCNKCAKAVLGNYCIQFAFDHGIKPGQIYVWNFVCGKTAPIAIMLCKPRSGTVLVCMSPHQSKISEFLVTVIYTPRLYQFEVLMTFVFKCNLRNQNGMYGCWGHHWCLQHTGMDLPPNVYEWIQLYRGNEMAPQKVQEHSVIKKALCNWIQQGEGSKEASEEEARARINKGLGRLYLDFKKQGMLGEPLKTKHEESRCGVPWKNYWKLKHWGLDVHDPRHEQNKPPPGSFEDIDEDICWKLKLWGLDVDHLDREETQPALSGSSDDSDEDAE
ncbi:uncharacterized protein BO97DRAFT_423308 [Aspergillus homomorphus CBS 101889]|uniref:Uncharacterized protein n=1 Tax=Aspergillus homomorphus (strain CBS 101889) TaxID=1450537 RepID=A0A395I2L5_ASPHC|nr:hypothetical protein BO97DRAFT_423308 [Aspergillus homomorphus CBS 101889]RAL13929.1 hypothetical protein BO97DRAFT_423308 [Aspergillus homomorphus CBS 101889]